VEGVDGDVKICAYALLGVGRSVRLVRFRIWVAYDIAVRSMQYVIEYELGFAH
jgi:hypothetical protein